MHVPLSWLREYVTVDATAKQIADRLFTSAAQVSASSTSGCRLTTATSAAS
jgi:hypothetical protein